MFAHVLAQLHVRACARLDVHVRVCVCVCHTSDAWGRVIGTCEALLSRIAGLEVVVEERRQVCACVCVCVWAWACDLWLCNLTQRWCLVTGLLYLPAWHACMLFMCVSVSACGCACQSACCACDPKKRLAWHT